MNNSTRLEGAGAGAGAGAEGSKTIGAEASEIAADPVACSELGSLIYQVSFAGLAVLVNRIR